MGEGGLELVKNGLTQPGGNVPNDAGDYASDGILCLFGSENALVCNEVSIFAPETVLRKCIRLSSFPRFLDVGNELDAYQHPV